jgi:hypothetical protein
MSFMNCDWLMRLARDVELAVDQRVPLLVRLEQRRAGVDLDRQADVGRLRLLRDHLHHVVAHVALAARELVRSAHRDGLREGAGGSADESESESRTEQRFHAYPPPQEGLNPSIYTIFAARSRAISASFFFRTSRSTSSVC